MTQMFDGAACAVGPVVVSRATVPLMNGFSDCRVAVIVLQEVITIPFAVVADLDQPGLERVV